MNPKRQKLIALSNAAKLAIEMGQTESSTINAAIMENYPDGEFHTFNGWRKEGYKVKKGSTAFLIWGRKRAMSKKDKSDDGTETEKKFNCFPVCYLFHKSQVQAN